tara:strand:- start:130 stop:621 length:492 start_codon:yes stop_codon:yes gene_type:complete
MSNIDKIKSKQDISSLIRSNLILLKKDIKDHEFLEKVKKIKEYKQFSLSGLTICPEDTSSQATELDSWYGYSIIKTNHSSELGWMISRLSKSFRYIFYGMEGREYFYDLLLLNLKKDCDDKKPINTILNNLIISSELILVYYENDKLFSDNLWTHLRDKNKIN